MKRSDITKDYLVEKMMERMHMPKEYDTEDLVDYMVEEMKAVIESVEKDDSLAIKEKGNLISTWNKRISEFLGYHFEILENGIYFAHAKYREYGLNLKRESKAYEVFFSIAAHIEETQLIDELADIYMEIFNKIDNEFEIEFPNEGHSVYIKVNVPATKENIEKYSHLDIEYAQYPDYDEYIENVYDKCKDFYEENEPAEILLRLSDYDFISYPMFRDSMSPMISIKRPCISYSYILEDVLAM